MHLTNLVVPAGADWGYAWPLLGDDGTTPLDTAGWTASGSAITWDPAAGTTVRATWSSSPVDDESLIDLGGSTATLYVPAAVSAAWEWRVGAYEVRLVDPSGRVDRTISGRMVVDQAESPAVSA